jgi:hypothetical protein
MQELRDDHPRGEQDGDPVGYLTQQRGPFFHKARRISYKMSRLNVIVSRGDL